MTNDPQWYVVHTQPHAETKAATHLTRQGYTIYLPRYLKQRRHARRVEAVAAPLFPRYMFVAIDRMTQRWRSIQSTVGVSHLVCNGEQPATIAAGVIDELQSRQDERGLIHLDLRPRFAISPSYMLPGRPTKPKPSRWRRRRVRPIRMTPNSPRLSAS